LNLQCSASQAGSLENSRIKVRGTDIQVEEGRDLFTPDGQELDATSRPVLPCGVDGLTSKIGYLLLLGVMIATSFFQTLQTQRASPSGAASNQQQMLLRIMPVFFGFISWSLPSGLPLYWTVTNLFMIGQQTLLLRAGHIGPEALERRMAEQKTKLAAQGDKPQKKGRLATMMERAEEQQKQRQTQKSPPKKSPSKGAPPKGTQRKGSSQTQRKKKPGSGSGGSRG
jgi:hypothetical protein